MGRSIRAREWTLHDNMEGFVWLFTYDIHRCYIVICASMQCSALRIQARKHLHSVLLGNVPICFL